MIYGFRNVDNVLVMTMLRSSDLKIQLLLVYVFL